MDILQVPRLMQLLISRHIFDVGVARIGAFLQQTD